MRDKEKIVDSVEVRVSPAFLKVSKLEQLFHFNSILNFQRRNSLPTPTPPF